MAVTLAVSVDDVWDTLALLSDAHLPKPCRPNLREDARPARDPRTERTQTSLVTAFNRLFLSQGYDSVTPALIASAAGVARSTFYAHFSGKPAVLRYVLRPVLRPLADTVCGTSDSNDLERVLQHFWVNRRIARSMMAGRPRLILQDGLAELMELNLKRARCDLQVPLHMAAASVAHAQVALLDSWLSRGGSPTASTLAPAIRALASASIAALRR
jgi:AcrR family transcriptional regulator